MTGRLWAAWTRVKEPAMKTPMAIPALLVGFLFQSSPPPAVRAGATRVVTFSPKRLLTEVTDVRAGLARLQELQRQKTADLSALQRALEGTRQQLARTPDADARLKLLDQEQKQRSELESAMSRAQADMQNSQQQFQAGIQNQVKPILDDLSKSQRFEVVLNGDLGVVWAAPTLDVTETVVQRLNSKSPAPTAP
jgi:Skp family chaperone for outer membrane proteins